MQTVLEDSTQQQSVPWPEEDDTIRNQDGAEWTVEQIGSKPGRVSSIVDLSPVGDERRRSMSINELRALLRHAGWEVE